MTVTFRISISPVQRRIDVQDIREAAKGRHTPTVSHTHRGGDGHIKTHTWLLIKHLTLDRLTFI